MVIEAMQFTGDNARTIATWAQQGGEVVHWDISGDQLNIHTLEGEMLADKGDWIIRGVMGEFYPCKPDIFEMTYEPA